MAEGQGSPGHDRDHVRAGPREVRADHTDRHRRQRAAVVDAAAAAVRSAVLIQKVVRTPN